MQLDPEATHFRYSRITVWELRIGIACGLFVSTVAVYSALFDPPSDEGQWPWLLGVMISMLIGSLVMVRFHHLVSSTYAITSSAVIQLQRRAIVRQLDWGQIRELRFRRSSGQLQLLTNDPDTSIRVEKQLVGFARFVEMAEECTGLETRVIWW